MALNTYMQNVEMLAIIYQILHANSLTFSQYDFSRRWLGMSQSYYSSLKATDRAPSIEALSKLKIRLDKEISSLTSITSFRFSPSLQARHKVLDSLTDMIAVHLQKACG